MNGDVEMSESLKSRVVGMMVAGQPVELQDGGYARLGGNGSGYWAVFYASEDGFVSGSSSGYLSATEAAEAFFGVSEGRVDVERLGGLAAREVDAMAGAVCA